MSSANTIRLFLLWICVVGGFSSTAQESVLRQDTWYKLAVEKNGVYKITYDLFKKMGFSPDQTDPRKIKIVGNIGGMLPQVNSTERPTDLTENSIFVSGESDGIFNKEDFILFYAEGADKIRFDVNREVTAYEHNLYSDKNFYFVSVGNTNGKRITPSANTGTGFPVINTYNDFIFHELDEYNELKSGREWYGERFDYSLEQTFTLPLPNIADNTTITWVSDVMAQAFNGSSFKLLFNNTLVAEQIVPAIPNVQNSYGEKGKHKRDTISFAASSVSAPAKTSQEIKYQYIRSGTSKSVGFLDFFLIGVVRNLSLTNDQTLFRSAASIGNPTSQFEIANATSTVTIWDVTDPSNAAIQTFSLANSTAIFSTSTNTLKEFIVFNTTVPAPTLVGNISNQNLHGASTPNLIIVTHPDFKTEALRLAQHRQQQGWTTLVTTTQEIFNEFSSGRQDVTAIRDFAKYLYDKNPSTLKSILLFGRGSYDYKDRVSGNTNYVPTYESRNSLEPLQTYSSDDYFGFLENTEGNWGESPAQNHTMDIGAGRLPVKSLEEARDVVDKIILYDTNKKRFGQWRKEIVFIADDGSIGDGFTRKHQEQADIMANEIELTQPAFNTRRTFLGTYTKTVKPNGETIPEANDDIKASFDRGTLIINYTGHGNEDLWADEKIFTGDDIELLENKLYPFMVTATCEFGRQDDPRQISSAERSVLHAKGGAIGLVTTARPVYSYTNFELNQAFYDALFQKEDNRHLTLGEIFRRTKNNSTSGVGNRNFSLLGDPSLTLAMPANNIVLNEIKTTSGSDTLKALSRVTVKGEVQDNTGVVLSNFNGTLRATLFDKETEFTTIGKNNPAFKFKEWDNTLFNGQADVVNGAFEFEFIIPKNITYEIGSGKMSLYAEDAAQKTDAAGAATQFKIGGSEPAPTPDNTAPFMQAFIGDTTFVNGGLTNANTTLLVRLRDAGGITISSYGIGNNLMATLDDDITFTLNDYYTSDKNDFTYGWIDFPLSNLSPGKHTITVKAWDTSNNGAETKIDFEVTDGEGIVIENFGNYPNPVADKTTFYFTHNKSGEDLDIELILYSSYGQEIKTYRFTEISSTYQINFPELDSETEFGKKLQPGLYLARLAVRSISNGSKDEQVTKLIVVN